MTYRDENLHKQHLELKDWDESRTVLCWAYSHGISAGDNVDNTFHIIDTESSPRYLLNLGNDSTESDDLAELEQLLAEWMLSEGMGEIPADMNYCPKVHAINDARSHRDMILHLHDRYEMEVERGVETYSGGSERSLADWDKYGDLLLKAFGVDLHDDEAHYEGFHKQCLKATEPEIVELAWTYCERLAAARDNDMTSAKLADTINELRQAVNENTTAGDALERLLACFTIRPDGTVGYNPDGITKTNGSN